METFPDHYTGLIGPVVIEDKTALIEATQKLLADARRKEACVLQAVERWKNVFQKIGAKPKYHSSLQAIKEYFDANEKIYAISPIVDFYNAYCLCNGLPMAAYDADQVRGDIVLRPAAKDEPFVPLGSPKQMEKTKNGEIVYADSEQIICRYWNLQDCHTTRITDDTRNVLFFFDLLDGEGFDAQAQWATILKDFQSLFGASIGGGLTGPKAGETVDLTLSQKAA